MSGKIIKYVLLVLFTGFIAYNSVYIKKLSEVKAAEIKPFNAREYARDYLYEKLPASYSKAANIDQLVKGLKADPKKAFAMYSHSQGDGDARYFLVSGLGTIEKIDENNVLIKSSGGMKVKLATEYIFGNTVRDAAGLISMDEFSNSMDINTVSEEINKLIKTEIIPPFKAKAQEGSQIEYKACLELNRSALKLDTIEAIPVLINIKN